MLAFLGCGGVGMLAGVVVIVIIVTSFMSVQRMTTTAAGAVGGFTADDSLSGCSLDAPGSLQGEADLEKIFHFFVSAGFSEEAAAGITGNIQTESGGDPTKAEVGYPDGWGTGVPASRLRGWGLVQWTWGRHERIRDRVIAQLGQDYYTSQYDSPAVSAENFPAAKRDELMLLELNFVIEELQGPYKASVYDPLMASSSIDEAAAIFVRKFEIPANVEAQVPIRQARARAIFDTFHGSNPDNGEQNATVTAGYGTCGGVGTVNPISDEELFLPTSNMACPTGTTDAGVATGQRKTALIQIRLCTLPFPGAGRVNANVAANFLGLLNAAQTAGYNVTITSSFRTPQEQAALVAAGAPAAAVGMSLHQMGMATDLRMTFDNGAPAGASLSNCTYWNDGNGHRWCQLPGSPLWRFLWTNFSRYHLIPLAREYWHWEAPAKSEILPTW